MYHVSRASCCDGVRAAAARGSVCPLPVSRWGKTSLLILSDTPYRAYKRCVWSSSGKESCHLDL
eukprot:6213269-Pleurochrysis_carterae.AAC.1